MGKLYKNHLKENKDEIMYLWQKCVSLINWQQLPPVLLHAELLFSQQSRSEKSGDLEFSTFLIMMHRQIQQEDPKTEILEALRMTDKQKKGHIQASELRAKLTRMGEKLTQKEGKRWCLNQKLITTT